MSINAINDLTGLTQSTAGNSTPTMDTGDLRRQFNFGSKEFARLDPSQQPYVHILSLFRNDPVDDSEFKFVERRPSFDKRFGYVIGHGPSSISKTTGVGASTITGGAVSEGSTYWFRIATDYDYNGNIGVRVGKGGLVPDVSDATRPRFIIVGTVLTIKVAVNNTWATNVYNGTTFTNATIVPDNFINAEVVTVTNGTGHVDITCKIVKGITSQCELTSFYDAITPMDSGTYAPNMYPQVSEEWGLESKRCRVTGNNWAQGSGLPDTWIDQPFSVGLGLTSIVKTKIAFDGTTMATVLKLEPNEYLRTYREKMFEHQVDKANAMYWSHQRKDTSGAKPKLFTQGTIDYALAFGNQFTISTSHTRDDFQQQLTEMKAAYGKGPEGMMFFADTVYFNWLFQLGGYWRNNVNVGVTQGYRMELTRKGEVNVGAVTFTIFGTPIGNIKIAEDPMLNGSPVAMFGVPVKDVAYRPLIGNGVNRDTTILRGVQTESNTGVDEHVDLIRTEFGMSHCAPEGFSVWTRA